MNPDQDGDDQEPWYSARCVFCRMKSGQSTTYEERVILIRAVSEEQAIRIAEEEAEQYAAEVDGWTYTGFMDLFHLFDTTIGHRTEVFSLMRSSELDIDDYIDRYYDTGAERARRDDTQL